MTKKVQLTDLAAMKKQGRKIVGVVAWDYQMARIVDRAGVDLVSVGDTVGINLWGHPNPLEVTMDEMVVVCKAVRRGTKRALVSCDFPFGPMQESSKSAVRAAIRLVKEAGVDMVKLDGAADHLDAVAAVTRAGIPVFAQFGITPQTSLKYGVTYSATPNAGDTIPDEMLDEVVGRPSASRMRAALLNFTNSGPVAGAAIAQAVSIPVLGGFGRAVARRRVRMATARSAAARGWIGQSSGHSTPTSLRSHTTQ